MTSADALSTTMPWQRVWGANLLGVALMLLALWVFAVACWPVSTDDSEEDADA